MISFGNHAFKGLDHSLKQLFDLLVSMGGNVQELLAVLPRGLEVADPELFNRAKEIDKKINEAERQADVLVAGIINKFTTMGEDLRFIIGSIKIAGLLERAADKVKNCHKRLAKVSHPLDPQIVQHLSSGIGAVSAMIPLAIAQIVDYHDATAKELLKHGSAVQKAYRQALLHLHETKGEDTAHILLIAKNLEQTADMAVEIMKVGHYIHFATKYEKEKADA